MKTFTTSILALATTLSLATAAPAVQARDSGYGSGYGSVQVTLLGATDNNQQSYSVTVPISESQSSGGTYTCKISPVQTIKYTN